MDRFQSAVWPSPRLSLLISPVSEGEPGTPTSILQMSHERFREAFPLPMAQQTGGDVPAAPSREAEPPRRRSHSDPQNQQAVDLPMSMLMNPIPAQTQNPQPAVGPPPLNLRSSSPAAMRVQVEPAKILCRPWAPRDSHQPNVGFLPPSTYPRLDLCPYTFVPSTQVWYDPCPCPASLFFGHEHPPSWYLSPQTVLVHQNFSPVLNSSNTINVLNVNVTMQSHAETRDEQQNQQAHRPHRIEGRERPTEQVRQELWVSAEPPGTSAQTVVRPEACEDSPRSPCPQCREEEDEHKLEADVLGNSSFFEYLDELCSDENIRNADWMDVDPDSFLNNPSQDDASLWSPYSDPNLQQTREDYDWGNISPLLPSHLLERQDDLTNSAFPSCDGNCTEACPYYSFFQDYTTHSASEPEQQGVISLDRMTAKGDRQQQCAISFKECTKKSKKTHRSLTEREEVPLEQTRKQVDNTKSETKPNIFLTFTRLQSLQGQSKNKDRYEIISPQERNRTEDGVWKMDELTPKSRSRNEKSQNRQFSGRRLVFEREGGDSEETNATQQEKRKEHDQKKKKYTKQRGKPFSLLKAMAAILKETPSEEKESQTPRVVKPRLKSTDSERKANPPKARGKNSKRELETASEAQPLLIPSPIKRRRAEGEHNERVKVARKSTARTSKGSGNTSSPIQPKKHQRVEGGGQKASDSQAEERRKRKQPIEQRKSTCGRTEKSLESALALDTKWSQETLQQSLETQTNDLKSDGSKPEATRPAIKAPKPEQAAQRQEAEQVGSKGPAEKHHIRPTCGANKRDKGPDEARAATLGVETGQEKLEDCPAKRCRKEKQKPTDPQ